MMKLIQNSARSFRRSRIAAATIIVTLAVGIGAAVLAFAFLDGTLLSGLPYSTSDRLVWVSSGTLLLPFIQVEYVDPVDLSAWRNARSFAGWGVYKVSERTISTPASTARVGAASVGAGFLDVLDVKPSHGRDFLPEETAGAEMPFAIVTDSVWRTHLGSAPLSLQAVIKVDRVPHTVVGILPPSFEFPEAMRIGILTPLSSKEIRNTKVIAAIRKSISFDVAKAEVQSLAGKPHAVTFQRLTERQTAAIRASIVAVFFAADVIWILACLSLAAMVLGTGIARRSEVTLRMALGASRITLFKQFVAEYGMFALFACIGGIAMAYACRGLVLRLVPEVAATVLRSEFGPRLFAYAFGLAACSTTLSSVVLLWIGTLRHGAELLRSNPAGVVSVKHGRVLQLAVIVEFAAALIILFSGACIHYGFKHQRYERLGFKEDGMLTFRVAFAANTYKAHQIRFFMESVSERVMRLPGVRGVSFCSSLPPNPLALVAFETSGLNTAGALPPMVSMQVVGCNYFSLLNIPLVKGRALMRDDAMKATGVAMINRTLERRYFGVDSVIGRHVSLPGHKDLRIIGVVGDVRNVGLSKPPEPEVYIGMGQHTPTGATFVIETNTGDQRSLTESLQDIVRSLAPEQAISDVQTMGQRLSATVAPLHFASVLMTLFGAITLLLSAMGIYGISAYSTESRRRDMAVRLAFGATRARLVARVLGEMLVLCVIGAGIAFWMKSTVRDVLSDVLSQPVSDDGVILTVICTFSAGLACLAAYVPLHRFLAVDPLRTLNRH